MSDEHRAQGPVDATQVPRYAGPETFARLPRLDEVPRADARWARPRSSGANSGTSLVLAPISRSASTTDSPWVAAANR